jgi:type IV pilus assembly protein PilW
MTRKHMKPKSINVERGVTLIELMVGLVLGLLTTVVIAQVLATSEAQRRGTSIGSDAQTNGALALYTLQREVMSAGYGMAERANAFGCTIRAQVSGTNLDIAFEPLRIMPAAAPGGSDVLMVMASQKENFSTPLRVFSGDTAASNLFRVNHTLGVEVGDLLVAVPPQGLTPPTDCHIFNATSVDATQLSHDAQANAPWNQAPGTGPMAGVVYPPLSSLINMGTVARREFGVNAANAALTETLYSSLSGAVGAPQDMYANVVNFQALYGVDTNNDGTVDVYNKVQPTTAAAWQNVQSLRLVIVTRSAQRERDPVTAALPSANMGSSPTVDGATACGSSQCVVADVSSGNPDWQHHQYKVFDTVVPLKNLAWNKCDRSNPGQPANLQKCD